MSKLDWDMWVRSGAADALMSKAAWLETSRLGGGRCCEWVTLTDGPSTSHLHLWLSDPMASLSKPQLGAPGSILFL